MIGAQSSGLLVGGAGCVVGAGSPCGPCGPGGPAGPCCGGCVVVLRRGAVVVVVREGVRRAAISFTEASTSEAVMSGSPPPSRICWVRVSMAESITSSCSRLFSISSRSSSPFFSRSRTAWVRAADSRLAFPALRLAETEAEAAITTRITTSIASAALLSDAALRSYQFRSFLITASPAEACTPSAEASPSVAR